MPLELHPIASRPICARCNKPVDDLIEAEDHFMERLVFIACCHGERERVVIPWSDLASSVNTRLQFGRAFVDPPQLGPARK